MNDPLCPEPSPFEVLAVGLDADEGAVKAAYKDAVFKRGMAPNRAKKARDSLLRPLDRALCRAFVYEDRVLGRLTPNPLVDGLALGAGRERTLGQWEAGLGARPDDVGALHCCALAWFFSAVGVQGQGGADEAWRAAWAFWAPLVVDPSTWLPDEVGRGPNAAELGEALQNRLAEAARASGAGGVDLVLALETEVRAVRSLRQVLADAGSPVFGPTLLDRLGLREAMERRLATASGSVGAAEAQAALSPLAAVAVLVDDGKAERALAMLEGLDGDEARGLRRRALLIDGENRRSLGRVDGALECWYRARELSADDDERQAVDETIVTTCQHEALALKNRDRFDAAVALLEGAHRRCPDGRLQAVLAETLLQRGIKVINDAQNRAAAEREGASGSVMQRILAGKADVARAAELGSVAAKAQLTAADDVVRQAEDGFFELAVEIRDLVRRANDSAGQGDWETAVTALTEARERTAPRVPTVLTRNLAASLANRSGARISRAFEKLNAGTLRRQAVRGLVEAARKDLLQARALDPANESIPSSLRQIDGLVEQAGLDVPVEAVEAVDACDRATAPKDWDGAVDVLVKAVDGWSDGGAPTFVKKRLAAALANRAGAVFAEVADGKADEGKLRRVLTAARQDLSDARVLDPDNEVVRSSLANLAKVAADLPAPGVIAGIKRATAHAERPQWSEAVAVLRTVVAESGTFTPEAVKKNLAACLVNGMGVMLNNLNVVPSPFDRVNMLKDALVTCVESLLLNPGDGNVTTLVSTILGAMRANALLYDGDLDTVVRHVAAGRLVEASSVKPGTPTSAKGRVGTCQVLIRVARTDVALAGNLLTRTVGDRPPRPSVPGGVDDGSVKALDEALRRERFSEAAGRVAVLRARAFRERCLGTAWATDDLLAALRTFEGWAWSQAALAVLQARPKLGSSAPSDDEAHYAGILCRALLFGLLGAQCRPGHAESGQVVRGILDALGTAWSDKRQIGVALRRFDNARAADGLLVAAKELGQLKAGRGAVALTRLHDTLEVALGIWRAESTLERLRSEPPPPPIASDAATNTDGLTPFEVTLAAVKTDVQRAVDCAATADFLCDAWKNRFDDLVEYVGPANRSVYKFEFDETMPWLVLLGFSALALLYYYW